MPERKTGSRQREGQRAPRKPKADSSGVPKQPGNPNLLAGGVPGNRGGTGVKNKIRDLSIAGHQKVLTTLLSRVDVPVCIKCGGKMPSDKSLTNSELVALSDKLGKYGVGIKTEIEINNAALAQAVLTVMFKYCPEDMWQAAQSEIMAILDGGGDA